MRLALVAALGLATSCYREATPPAPIAPPAQPRAPARMVANADPLAFLPTDADAVIAIDARAIKSSQVWKQLGPILQPKLDSLLSLFKGLCKFDPIAQLKQASFAIRNLGGAASGVFVVRGYDKHQVIECIEASKKIDNRTITIDHDVITVAGSAVIGFADDTTLVSVFGPNASQAALAEALDGGAPLRMAPGFPALVERIERSHSWFVITGSAKALSSATLGAKPVAITGAANFTSAIDAEVRIRFDQPDQAVAATAMLQAQVPQLQSVLPNIDVSTDDVDTVMKMQMSSMIVQMMLGLVVP